MEYCRLAGGVGVVVLDRGGGSAKPKCRICGKFGYRPKQAIKITTKEGGRDKERVDKAVKEDPQQGIYTWSKALSG